MLDKDQQSIQELMAHPGWEIYKLLVLTRLKKQLQDKLHAEARAGESIKSAFFAGQIDILDVVLRLPNDYIQKQG